MFILFGTGCCFSAPGTGFMCAALGIGYIFGLGISFLLGDISPGGDARRLA